MPEVSTIVPKHPGRPSVINQTTVAKLLGALQRGLSIEEACNYAQIDRTTFYRHVKNDQEFCNTIMAAREFLKTVAADMVFDVLIDIQRERNGDKRKYSKSIAVRLAMWYLERKDPEGWSKFVCKEQCCQEKRWREKQHQTNKL